MGHVGVGAFGWVDNDRDGWMDGCKGSCTTCQQTLHNVVGRKSMMLAVPQFLIVRSRPLGSGR